MTRRPPGVPPFAGRALPPPRRTIWRALAIGSPLAVALLALSPLALPAGERAPAATGRHSEGQGQGQVILRAHDRAGRRLGWDAFRRVQENGHGEDGDNDVLLDPEHLTVLAGWPLHRAGDDPAVDWPGRPAALALAWPTSQGYSNLIVDLPGPGTYDLELLAATQARAALRRALAQRPSYRPSPRFRSEWRRLRHLLSAAEHADETRRGALGVHALDAAVAAYTQLLREYGVQHARRTHSHSARQWGFTLDDVSDARTAIASIAKLAGRDGWVRLVFDREQPPEHYRAAIDAAHHAGLGVVGQILDSSDMAAVSLADWNERVARYVTALPSVDEWEVGNEVNGNWLGADVPAKVAAAAAYVKQHTHARTLLTLYWQLGEDEPRTSMFSWAAENLPPELMADVDDLGISLYPEDHPMGLAFDRVFTTLHARFPRQRLLISELGYWSSDLGHTWWWGDQTDPTDRGRVAVARLYQAAVMGYPYSGGGTYWWYYRQEARAKTPLRQAFVSLYASIAHHPRHR